MKKFEAALAEILADVARGIRQVNLRLREQAKANQLRRANTELEESLTKKLRENMQGQPRDMRGRYARKGAMPRA